MNAQSADFFKTSPFLNCTRNPDVHQELYQQYKTLKENSERKTMDRFLESLAMQQEDIQSKINQTADRLWHRRQILPHQPQNIRTIRHAVEQRLSNITNRLTCIEK